MAKRFTDTGKWDKASFDCLSAKMKLVWIYLCDKCDHAGIWDVNFRQLSFHLGEQITEHELGEAFAGKIVWLSARQIFLPAFVEFQYGALNPENRAHLSVLNRLHKEGAYKHLTSSLRGAKDKDKEKDKGSSSLEKGSGEKPFRPTDRDLALLYAGYPRKEGKSRGLKKLKADISSPADLGAFLTAVENYRATLKRKGTEDDYVKLFSTFAHEWRDWLDPTHGHAEDFSADATGRNDAAINAIFEKGSA